MEPAKLTCRVLPFEVADGAANMAADEALLDAVDADPSSAVLRTYGWSEPTLSLGYFQPLAAVQADPRWRGAPIVRRPSGGGALWHDRELTYALIVPRSHPAAGRPSDLYRAVHAAITALLRASGFDAHRRGESPASGERPFLCFADRDPEDVVVGPWKVAGSAQRRRPRAVLQHGAVLLGRSPATPELPGLAELSGPAEDRDVWSARLLPVLTDAMGLHPLLDSFRPFERLRAGALARDRYREASWTARR